MIKARCPVILLSLMLGACSSNEPPLPEWTYVPPSPPTEKAIVDVIPMVASETKLASPLQISDVRPADHGGPGGYYVCLREANPPPDTRQRYYAVFFDNEIFKGERLSVIMDQCETQTFRPLPAAAPPPSATNAKTARHKAARD
jgi:hypothetical protein